MVTTEAPTTAPNQMRSVIHLGDEEAGVTRLAPAPCATRPTVAHEAAYLSALAAAANGGQLPACPPAGFVRALARAAIEDPRIVTGRIRNGLTTAHTDTTDVTTVRTSFSPLTVLPGEQPRGGAAGGRPTQVREPLSGHDSTATRLGLRVLTFDDREHLRAWVADSLTRSLTRAIKRGRALEIAATGVRRPVSASMTLLTFADGTAPQWVPMLSDGLSRLAVCAAGVLGHLEGDPEVVAGVVSDRLLPTDDLTPSSPAHELVRRMRRQHDNYVREYERHLVDSDHHVVGLPDEHGVLLRQFLSLPADLHLLACDPATGDLRPMEAALEAVVSDLHTGIDAWAPEDGARHTALRALKRMADSGDIDPHLLDLCANRAELTESTALCTTSSHHDSDGSTITDAPTNRDGTTRDRLLLRRAVTIMAALLGPTHYAPFKQALRDLTGRRRLTMQQTVEYLAPLLCEPWGTAKPTSRAWAYGGCVPSWISETQLTPAHPADYLDLVDIALDPGATPAAATAARLELALAGGTALIADGLLTTALVGGSGGATAQLPFRGSVNAAVEALTGTEEGLYSLAVAANHFRPSQTVRTARLPAIDLDQPDRVARDGMGVPVRTTETALSGYAAQAHAAHDPQPTPPTSFELTPLESLQSRARHLPRDTRSLLHEVELTKSLYDETGGPTGLRENELDAAHDALSQALRLVGRLS